MDCKPWCRRTELLHPDIPPGNAPALHAARTPRSASLSCSPLPPLVNTPASINSSTPNLSNAALLQQSHCLSLDVCRNVIPYLPKIHPPKPSYCRFSLCTYFSWVLYISKALISPASHHNSSFLQLDYKITLIGQYTKSTPYPPLTDETHSSICTYASNMSSLHVSCHSFIMTVNLGWQFRNKQ